MAETGQIHAYAEKVCRNPKIRAYAEIDYALSGVLRPRGRRIGALFGSGKEQLEREGHSASDQEKSQETKVQYAEQGEEATGG